MLIGASTAAIVIPQRVFSLPPWPPRDFNTADMRYRAYFTSKDAWYLQTEHPDGIALYSRAHPLSNSLAEAVDLSEESIEQLCIELRKLTDNRGVALTIRPTRRIVSPMEYHYLMSEGE